MSEKIQETFHNSLDKEIVDILHESTVEIQELARQSAIDYANWMMERLKIFLQWESNEENADADWYICIISAEDGFEPDPDEDRIVYKEKLTDFLIKILSRDPEGERLELIKSVIKKYDKKSRRQ